MNKHYRGYRDSFAKVESRTRENRKKHEPERCDWCGCEIVTEPPSRVPYFITKYNEALHIMCYNTVKDMDDPYNLPLHQRPIEKCTLCQEEITIDDKIHDCYGFPYHTSCFDEQGGNKYHDAVTDGDLAEFAEEIRESGDELRYPDDNF